MPNPLWEYSLAKYALDGVPDLCIELQDECGVDVNILLYAAWLASLGYCMSAQHLSSLQAQVTPWRVRVVMPLRALRRDLHDLSGADRIRAAVKDLELAAEQQQQDGLYRFYSRSDRLPQSDAALLPNLSLVAQDAGCDSACWLPPTERLAALLAP